MAKTTAGRRSRRIGVVIAFALGAQLGVTLHLMARPTMLAPAYRVNGKSVTKVVDDAVARARAATVTVLSNGKAVALGTIVSADGLILTKSSELKGTLGVTTTGGKGFRPEIVTRDKANDLALLKIDASKLPVVRWADASRVDIGQWVAAPWPDGDNTLRLGIVSARRRSIPRAGGVLGVILGQVHERHRGVVISQVMPNSAAAAVKLKVGDAITHVNGLVTDERTKLIKQVTSHAPGDTVKLKVRRGPKVLDLEATLGDRNKTFGMFSKNRRVSGPVSRRSDGFAAILQHDIALGPDACGGPLVDLEGKVVGINIARVNRSESFALPADLVVSLLRKMAPATAAATTGSARR
ncbi:MAG: PDZ domain-containing protein [Phycisphaerae bacterium]|nr:PDZ domain-containing protein [Phycisphaerae bacterium]